MSQLITGKEACELISEHWASLGINKTWKEIWNYSSTGELFKIYEWFEEAKKWKLGLKKNEDKL